jgi:hypothetical protein
MWLNMILRCNKKQRYNLKATAITPYIYVQACNRMRDEHHMNSGKHKLAEAI